MKTVLITSNLPKAKDGSDPLAIWEKNEAHPEGEIWVSGDTVVEAALTPVVIAAIRNEKVVEVSESSAKTAKKKTPLPKEFPGLAVLNKNGVKTYESLIEAPENEVKNYEGMTVELFAEIAKAVNEFVKAKE